MISEQDTKWCANEDARAPRELDCEIHGEWNETFLIRVETSP